MLILKLICSLSFCVVQLECARILCIFFVPSISHQLVFHPIYRELSLRGHEVIAVTPNPLKDTNLINLTEISLDYLYELKIPLDTYATTYTNFLTKIFEWIFSVSEEVLKDPQVQQLCNDNKTSFDLVLVEALNPVLYAFGYKCNAPTIGIMSMDGMLSSHSVQGNPIHPLLYADNLLGYSEPFTLRKKLLYSYNVLWFKIFYEYSILRRAEKLKNQYFGRDFPAVDEIERNSSMLFLETNFAIYPVRPLVPTTIPLGFTHIKSTKPLANDLQSALDNATSGAVYFSLGSNVRSSELPEASVKLIKDALSELPYTVLWKWESDDVPDVRSNVITRKWFPQQDILAHKNLKGFVTQGGLQSLEEAIHYGVPMVGIPFLGDQEMNVKQSMKQGISIYVDHTTMTKDELKKCIMEIMQNPKYFKRIQELKEIAHDQPMTGLERAVWWSEYVIRHKGAKHLRSPVADMPLWEYLMLDVIAVVLTALIIAGYILCKIIRFLLRILFRKSGKLKKT